MRKIIGFIDKYGRTICRDCAKKSRELKHVIKQGTRADCDACGLSLGLEILHA